MNEIEQIITDIRDFINGKDHSCSSRLQRLHSLYSQALSEEVSYLNKCKSLIENDLLADARKYNRSFTPSLTERAKTLLFPGNDSFANICALYNMAPFPAIDHNIINALNAPPKPSEINITSLLQEWRRVARAGATSEKMRILREIVASSPKGIDAWKRNLAEVEKVYYNELLGELNNIADDLSSLDRLQEINQELHSDILLTPPQTELLQKLQQKLLPLQKMNIANLLDGKLDEMQAFYSANELNALNSAYSQWLHLCSNPLASPTEEQKQTASDIKAFIDRKNEEQQRHERFKMLSAEFEQKLDKNAPFSEIERIYNMLLLLDIPLPEKYSKTMQRLSAEAQEYERWLNRRRCIFGICIAVFAIVLVGISIFLLNNYINLRNSRNAMLKLMNDKDYKGAMDYYETLTVKSPKLSSNPQIMKLYTESQTAAQRREEEIQMARQQFQELSQLIKKMLTEDFLNSNEFEEAMKKAEMLRPLLDEEGRKMLSDMYENAIMARKQLVQNRVKQFTEMRDKAFLIAETCLSSISHESDLEEVKSQINSIDSQFKALLLDDKVDTELREQSKQLWQIKISGINVAIKTEEDYRSLVNKLERPSNFEQYISSLEELTHNQPELAVQYSEAIKLTNQWKLIKKDASEMKHLFENYVNRQTTSAPAELTIFTSTLAKYFLHKECQQLSQFFSDIRLSCNLYELVFGSPNGNEFFFYSELEPILERDKTNRKNLRNISFFAKLESGRKPIFFSFRIEGQGDSIVFKDSSPMKHQSINIPARFTNLKNWPKTHKCSLFLFEKEFQNELNTSTLEETIINSIGRIDSILNPYHKLETFRNLVIALKEISPFFSQELKPALAELEKLNINTSNWFMPCELVGKNELVDKISNTVSLVNTDTLAAHKKLQLEFLQALFERRIIPAAIVQKDAQGKYSLHSILNSKPNELLVIGKDKIHMIAGDFANGNITSEQDVQMLFKGQLLWTYQDGISTEKFLRSWKERFDEQNIKTTFGRELCPTSLQYILFQEQ